MPHCIETEITDSLVILIYEWSGIVYNKRDHKYEVIFVKTGRTEKETAEKDSKSAKDEVKTLVSAEKTGGETESCDHAQYSAKEGEESAEKTKIGKGTEGEQAKRRTLSEKLKLILILGLSFLKIGLFTFGGGYAMIALIQKEFVSKRKWVGETEFMDVVAIAESTPGPLAINSATYIGYKVGKTAGAAISTLCVCIPSFVIIYLISLFFDAFLKFTVVQYAFKGIQVCVVFLIFTAGWKMLKQMQKDLFNWILFAGTFLCLLIFSVTAVDFSSVFYILICGAAGLCIYLISLARKRERKKLAAVSVQKQNDVMQKNEQNLQRLRSEDKKTDAGVQEINASTPIVMNRSGQQEETKNEDLTGKQEKVKNDDQTKIQETIKEAEQTVQEETKSEEEKALKERKR